MSISVVILTLNAATTLEKTLLSAQAVSDDIHVVDSGSTDQTIDIANRAGARVVTHAFEHYGAQRNWAIDQLPLKYEWQLHLDADERLSDDLAREILQLKTSFPATVDGYFVPRLVHFLGTPIRHGGMYPIWHMRLFRKGKARCEQRMYDQHFHCVGPTRKLAAPMIDDIRLPLGEWTTRHNRWAEAEVAELMNPTEGVIQGSWAGNPVERKRALRGRYDRLPLLVRPFLFFFYRYILRRGFLDGQAGLIFFVLQTFWFRFLVDAKLVERRMMGRGQ